MVQPLPESDFKYRRVFSYAVATVTLALVAWIIWRIEEADPLANIAYALLVLNWFCITYYMAAPSAEQIVRIVQSARLFGKGGDDGN